jgi:2-dehydro-3-deoxygluconokinase
MGTSKKVVGFGELLLRLGTHQFQRFTQARDFEAYYTGAEANTCVSLVNYGFEGYVVSKVPANDIGQACINFLKGHGLNTDFVTRGGIGWGCFISRRARHSVPRKSSMTGPTAPSLP